MLLDWKKDVSKCENKQAHFLNSVILEQWINYVSKSKTYYLMNASGMKKTLKNRKSPRSLSECCWIGKKMSQNAKINKLTF